MCGRYSLGLRPAQVRAYLEDNDMPVYEAPPDEGDEAPRQSYNFAPGYNGIVYRADVPDWGAGPRHHKKGEEVELEEEEGHEGAEPTSEQDVRYKLQSMKWGLIPFWTKRNPDYGSMLKTINCRDDSLSTATGMWNTIKPRKRCIVVAQGFYEWLKNPHSKDKVPHFVKRRDGKLMCMAGLWDCCQYENSPTKLYTYTVITTSSNAQLSFLHDRMPVILDNGGTKLNTWLDPKRHVWTKELQDILKPYDGELDVYPVSQEVGKVGNNSERFIVHVDSVENKANIANFFANAKKKTGVSPKKETTKKQVTGDVKKEPDEERKTIDHEGTEDNAPLPVPKSEAERGMKREHDNSEDELPKKAAKLKASTTKPKTTKGGRSRDSTSNKTSSPVKSDGKGKGSQKITSFFAK